jgi:hypothetical protein
LNIKFSTWHFIEMPKSVTTNLCKVQEAKSRNQVYCLCAIVGINCTAWRQLIIFCV